MKTPLAVVTLALMLPTAVVAQQPSVSDLRIVVIEGENAVNIIQQKTAVRPLIEVRDRNNLPVAGATVTFSVSGPGAAFAGGAQTLTVTTNAVGQAAASGFSAVSSGAVQVQVQAAFQGQIATAAITQTNFATAAAAAQAGATATGASGAGGAGGAGGGSAGGAAGGGAAGGGGISGTTIGIVGGAVAAGAVAATQIAGGGDEEQDNEDNANSFDGYDGSFSGQISIRSESVGTNFVCTFVYGITGTTRIELKQDGTGTGSILGTLTLQSATNGCTDSQTKGVGTESRRPPVTGGPSALAFIDTTTTVGGVEVQTFRFTGTLTGNNINGTMVFEITPGTAAGPRRSGTASMPVTLIGPRP